MANHYFFLPHGADILPSDSEKVYTLSTLNGGIMWCLSFPDWIISHIVPFQDFPILGETEHNFCIHCIPLCMSATLTIPIHLSIDVLDV